MTAESELKIWKDGTFVNWQDCQLHVMSHVVHYGSSVFEGIRCYEAQNDSVVFRLRDHMVRLLESAKIYRMEPEYSVDQLCDTTIALIRENNLKDCYIRPIIYRGVGAFGLLPFKCKLETAIACWSWGAYLGEDSLVKGIDVKVSTWNRMSPNTLPPMAKAGGNYLNSQLIKMEAVLDGYAEGIALDINGLVSEGSGANIFCVKDGALYTPPLTSSILQGLTRDSVMSIADKMGYKVIEKSMPRESLYLADELFFTGTAAEITPIRSVDKIKIGGGERGPITEKIQKEFFAILRQESPDTFDWLTPVYS